MNSENNNTGFIYNFDMSKEIPHFKRMAEHIQSSAESNAVDVIYESFVVTGDQDYLMSRLLAQKGLPRGFYWAAAQAIEKYLKAFLLMNDESVKKYSIAHPIKELFKAACKVDASIATLNILPHQNIQVDASVSKYLKTFDIKDFIDDIKKHGSADNRYNAFGVEYNTGHLCAMDSLSFKLRKKIGAIEIDRSFKKLSPDLIETFEKNNPWFQKEENHLTNRIPSQEFPIQFSSSITHFEFLVKNESNTAYKIALQWLREKMKLKVNGKSQ